MTLNNQAKITYKIVFPSGAEEENEDFSNLLQITMSENLKPNKPLYFPKNLDFNFGYEQNYPNFSIMPYAMILLFGVHFAIFK